MSITNTDIARQLQSIIDRLLEDDTPAMAESTKPAGKLDDPDELRGFLTDRIMQAIIDIDEENIEHGYVADDHDMYQVQFADLFTIAYTVRGALILSGVQGVPAAGILISLLGSLMDYEEYDDRAWNIPTNSLHEAASQATFLLTELIAMKQEEES
ncbi:hypothetical protein [Bifidobacterium cuniculi]|uniref:Uncharacterized protein n=1 Tax=Bifidobacterium cuniculi TaxID=1688 RepID=A0A087B3X8_9BIFI|nr:hypothetical protein [Bifidobacterium cuniculi]KFI65728.1 hypothetical protein BCUN_0223 [Bifidobacterium cuniculi]